MIDKDGKFIGQHQVDHATWRDRVKMWAADRVRAFLGEYTNTDLISSGMLLERLGDSDLDTTERTARRGRFQIIEKLRKQYKGEAKYGNQYTRVITDFHAALQMGQGIRTSTKDPKADPPDQSPELEAWDEFLDFNDLDAEGAIDLGVAGELDGQILMRLAPDPVSNNVRAWIVPLLETRYHVEFANPWEPTRAVLHPGTAKEEIIPPDEFCFLRLRGVVNGSYGVPTCANVVKEIEDLDLALRDLRQINKLFAHPTPIFTGKDEKAKKRIANDLVGMNWKLGMAFVMVYGDLFELHTLPAGALETMFKEIVNLVQIISGSTSIPVHYMGFPDLMSNRSVADLNMESPVTHARKAQKRFGGFFEEMAVKVFRMLSVLHGRDYDASKVLTSFPDVSKSNVKNLVETWLPVRLNGEITRRTFLTNIGHEDPDAEINALEEEGGDGRGDEEIKQEEERIKDLIQAAQGAGAGG